MRAALGAIVAVQAAHQRGFAGAGRAGQDDALAGADIEIDAGQHGHAQAAAQMQGEGFRQRLGLQHHGSCVQHRTDKQLRVRMVRIVQHLVGQPGFHDPAALHHRDPVRQQPSDRDVMRHQHHGDAQAGHQ